MTIVNPTQVPLSLTGATAATRYVGGTASGAPASGTFAVGDFVVDQTGIVWVCTTAGSPGTWTAVQPGTELGYAQLTSLFTTASTTLVDVTGLSVTVTVGARPVLVNVWAGVQNLSAAGFAQLEIDEDGSQVQFQTAGLGSVNEVWPVLMSVRRAPAAGSHTYKLRALSSSAGNTVRVGAGAAASSPAFIQVVQV